MHTPKYLGIDCGTTVLKLGVFDGKNGSVLAQSARRLPVRSFPNGGREQDLCDINHAFDSAINELRESLGSTWQTIAGIGLAAQGGSTIIAERSTGRALMPMILWDDGRTHAYMERLAQNDSPSFWRKYTGSGCPPAGLGRLIWLRESQPQLFREDTIHIGAGEYLFFRLTGLWRQDAGNAVQIGTYQAVRKKLFSRIIEKAGVSLSFFAPLRCGHETASLSALGARRLHLPANIPVAGPYIDQETGYLSACGNSGRPLQCSLGTAWVGNFVLPDAVFGSSPTQLVLPSPLRDKGHLIVQPLLTGNMTWEWGLRELVESSSMSSIEAVIPLFRSSLLPMQNLVFLPWLAQPNPLSPSQTGAGVFHGVSVQTSRAELLRAVAAGMCCEMARMFEEVKANHIIDSLVLGGGAGKGVYFRKLIAALFHPVPVYQQMDIDLAAARGAVYAFDPKIAVTKTKPLRPPQCEFVEKVQRYYHHYVAAFHKLYGSVPAGGAFQIERKK